MKKKEPEILSAKEVLSKRIRNAEIVDFILSRFMEYATENDNWEKTLRPLEKKFIAYMDESTSTEVLTGLIKVVDCGLPFISSCPVFSMHEVVEAGAKLTYEEMAKFTIELGEKTKKASTRQVVLPYIAVVGLSITEHMEKSKPEFNMMIELKIARLRKVISAGFIKQLTEETIKPIKKAVSLLENLEAIGVNIDEQGNLTDKDGNYNAEIAKLRKHERNNSSTTTPGKGTEGISGIPENLN